MREPGVLVFPEPPRSTAEASESRIAPAHFPTSSAAPRTAASSPAEREPGAPLSFPPAPSRPVAPPLTRGPAPSITPTVAPRPVFGGADHPLLATALKAASLSAPELAKAEDERLRRAIGRLLPLTLQSCEDWGNRAMEDCRQHALQCSGLTARFNNLDSASKIEQIVKAATPVENTLEKLRRRLSGLSVVDQENRVHFIRRELEALLQEVRKLRPEAIKDGNRLAVKTLAFRAVLEATGTPSDTTFELVIERRRKLLHAALQQAEMLPHQLKTLEQTAVLQMAQCDQLLHVALPAMKNAAGARR